MDQLPKKLKKIFPFYSYLKLLKFLWRLMSKGLNSFLVLYGSSSNESRLSVLLALSIETLFIIFWQFFKAIVRLLIYRSMFLLISSSLTLVIELTTLFSLMIYTFYRFFFFGWLYTWVCSYIYLRSLCLLSSWNLDDFSGDYSLKFVFVISSLAF